MRGAQHQISLASFPGTPLAQAVVRTGNDVVMNYEPFMLMLGGKRCFFEKPTPRIVERGEKCLLDLTLSVDQFGVSVCGWCNNPHVN